MDSMLIRKVKLREMMESFKNAEPEVVVNLDELFVDGCPEKRISHLTQQICTTASLFGYEAKSLTEKRITLQYAIPEERFLD